MKVIRPGWQSRVLVGLMRVSPPTHGFARGDEVGVVRGALLEVNPACMRGPGHLRSSSCCSVRPLARSPCCVWAASCRRATPSPRPAPAAASRPVHRIRGPAPRAPASTTAAARPGHRRAPVAACVVMGSSTRTRRVTSEWPTTRAARACSTVRRRGAVMVTCRSASRAATWAWTTALVTASATRCPVNAERSAATGRCRPTTSCVTPQPGRATRRPMSLARRTVAMRAGSCSSAPVHSTATSAASATRTSSVR